MFNDSYIELMRVKIMEGQNDIILKRRLIFMRCPLVLSFTLLIFFIFPPSLMYAAEIRVYGGETIVLDGPIVEGDFEKIFNVAKKVGPSLEKIFLNSLGGNLVEAMRIGRMVRELRWETEVADFFIMVVFGSKYYEAYGLNLIKESEHELACASSCFFIYAAGIYRFGGDIGIHRPFLNEEICSQISGNDAIDFSVSANQVIKKYLIEMGIPEHIYNTMLSISKNSIHWLTHEEQDEIEGYIPALEDWLDGKCGSNESVIRILDEMELKMGKDNPLFEKFIDILFDNWECCRQEAMKELRKEAWEKFFKNN